MASKTTGRSLQCLVRRARTSCECATRSSQTSSIRELSTSAARRDAQYDTERARRPRWSYTPEKMMAPYPWKPRDPEKAWECNSNPERLDRFYINMLGRGGDTVLSEEVKWLAITHKSFDQGRRGFNDRLAFFGRRILNLQLNLALLHSPTATQTQSLPKTSEGREPFTHPALDGLANLSNVPVGEILTKSRLGKLATQMGMRDIIRWLPRKPDNLDGSGIDVVLTTSLYAIIGAIALQRGGDVAAEVARERILKPLGIS